MCLALISPSSTSDEPWARTLSPKGRLRIEAGQTSPDRPGIVQSSSDSSVIPNDRNSLENVADGPGAYDVLGCLASPRYSAETSALAPQSPNLRQCSLLGGSGCPVLGQGVFVVGELPIRKDLRLLTEEGY